MFNNKEKLRGLSCVVLKRCSSPGQVGTSIGNQGRTTEQVIEELKLKVVHEEVLPGVSGSVPGNRDDIDRLLERKKTLNDFRLVLVQDASRFTRAGSGHGQKLIYDLRAAGILVYFVAEDVLVDSEMAEMYVSFLFSAARHAVKMLAYNSVTGVTASYLAQRSPYTKRPPFGLDRMYSDGGVDRHIIRNLPDGTQAQLNPSAGQVVRRFGRNDKKGVPNHYIKQKSESVRLVPGDPRYIAVIHLIFRLHLISGWTFHRIALHLNDHGVPSPCGKEWYSRTVGQVLRNPIYIGRGIRGRTKDGIYFITAAGSPTPSEVTLEELAKSRYIKPQRRPRAEWLEQPQPHLAEFLPEDLRNLATRSVEAHLDAIADGKPLVPQRDRHWQSTFWLKGFIFSQQGGYPMTGRRGGKNGQERSYAVSRGQTAPKTNNVLAGRIAATALEAAVLDLIRQVVLNRPGLEEAIQQAVAAELGQRRADQQRPEQLERDLRRKRKQLLVLAEDVSLDEDDALSRKVAAIKAEIRALEQRRQEAQGQQPVAPVNVAEAAAQMAKEFEVSGAHLEPQDIPHLRRLLEMLGVRIEADLVTKAVDISFALPSWVGSAVATHGPVGLVELSACRTSHQAHPENRRVLGLFQCGRRGRPVCFDCRRVKRAA